MRNGTVPQAKTAGELHAISKAGLNVFEDYLQHNSASQVSTELVTLSVLRGRYPEYTVTVTSPSTGILAFAKDGQATANLELNTESYSARRMHVPPSDRTSKDPGTMLDDVLFGKYDYQWQDHHFIVYTATFFEGAYQTAAHYILHKRDNELADSRCEISDALISAASQWVANVHNEVLVYDQGHWGKSKELWDSVKTASWDDVIMDKDMKESLITDVEGFYDCKEDYREFAVPWKRGIIFHGLPGNGKTISIKALMHALYTRPAPIPTLYVKSLAGCGGPEYAIREIFVKARLSAPCLLVFEDLDSLVTDRVKSFFLNEVDGLESNEGLLMLGSTNYLERLDAGISKRPGRFDRKYHFVLPATAERVKYCDYWRSKLAKDKAIDFPPSLSEAIAEITEGFSFAYLKETFITSLLSIVGSRGGNKKIESLPDAEEEANEHSHLLLWRVMGKQVQTLRAEMEDARKSAEAAAKNY